MMKANFKTETKGEVFARRGEALDHLDKLRKTQSSNAPWLPEIAEAVSMELLNFVELCNEKLDLIEDENSPVPYDQVVQLAFDFLFSHTIKEDEIPF